MEWHEVHKYLSTFSGGSGGLTKATQNARRYSVDRLRTLTSSSMPVMIVYCHTIEVRVSWSCLSAHIVPDPKEAAGAAEGYVTKMYKSCFISRRFMINIHSSTLHIYLDVSSREARVYAMPPFYVEKDMGTLEPQPYLPRPSGGIAMEESCLRTPKRANEQSMLTVKIHQG